MLWFRAPYKMSAKMQQHFCKLMRTIYVCVTEKSLKVEKSKKKKNVTKRFKQHMLRNLWEWFSFGSNNQINRTLSALSDVQFNVRSCLLKLQHVFQGKVKKKMKEESETTTRKKDSHSKWNLNIDILTRNFDSNVSLNLRICCEIEIRR